MVVLRGGRALASHFLSGEGVTSNPQRTIKRWLTSTNRGLNDEQKKEGKRYSVVLRLQNRQIAERLSATEKTRLKGHDLRSVRGHEHGEMGSVGRDDC